MLLAARALGLDATLTTLYLQFEKEVEAALGLPPGVHSYALVPIGYPMGRFGRFAVLPSLMSSMKIDGARLTEICSDGKLGVCCSRFGGREEFTPGDSAHALDDKSSRGDGLFTGNVTIMRHPSK